MESSREIFFRTLTELRANLATLEECNQQLQKYNPLTPKHQLDESLQHFFSTCSLISSQLIALKSLFNGATSLEDRVVFSTHIRLVAKQFNEIKRVQRGIVGQLSPNRTESLESQMRSVGSDEMYAVYLQTYMVS